MPKTLQLRRGTTAEITANTPASGELFVDTDKKTVTVGDGSTAGGTILARNDRVSHVYNTANAVNGYAVSAFATANGANGLAAGAYNTANTLTQSIANNQSTSVIGGFTTNAMIIANLNGYLTSTANLAISPGATNSPAYIQVRDINSTAGNSAIFRSREIRLTEGRDLLNNGTYYLNNEQDLLIHHSGLFRRKVHTGLQSPNYGGYGGQNTYREFHLYANTSNATIAYAGVDGDLGIGPFAIAGAFANGEFGIFETTIMAQSHGAAGSNSFDGTRFWKYETTFSKTPAALSSNSTLTFSSNTGNSGSWIANVQITAGAAGFAGGCDIAVQGEAGKNIFWYVINTQKSLWCTFAAGGGGGGGGK